MKDRDFLEWLAIRMVEVYKEPTNVDFVHKIRAIARRIPAQQDTNLFSKEVI